MRKDLKIGMAIGAVLLAVLLVYFAMPKPEGGDVAGVDPEGNAVAVDDGEATDAARTEEEGQTEPVSPPTETQKADVFAKGAEADAEAGDSVAARDAGGTNWAKLLEDGEGTLVPLRTTTPAVAARGKGGNDDAAVPAGARSSSGPGAGSASQSGDATAVGASAANASGSSGAAGARGDNDATPLRPDNDTASRTVSGQPKQAAVDPPGRYTIKPGDNYSTIAEAQYGSSRHYLAIEKANPDLDATRIRPGTVINLPDPATLKGSGEAAVAKVVDPEAEYEVQPNDSLYKIAVDRYGSSKMTDELYELNKEAIGPDPKRLKLGMILKLPPKPKGAESASR